MDGWEISCALCAPRMANAEKQVQTYSNSELRVNDTGAMRTTRVKLEFRFGNADDQAVFSGTDTGSSPQEELS